MLEKSMVVVLIAWMSTAVQAESPDLARRSALAGTCVLTLGDDGKAGAGVLHTIAVNDVVADVVKSTVPQRGSKKDPYYMLPPREVALNIACATPTAVAITATDNRSASRPPAPLKDAALMFGLGDIKSRPIGFFQIMLNDVELMRSDSGAFQPNFGILARPLGRGTGKWHTPPEEVKGGFLHQALAVGYTTMPSATPAAIFRLKGVLEIYPFVLRRLVDEPPSPVTLDGSVTIGMEYL